MSGKRIEAVQMRLMGKGSAAPGSTAFPFAGEIRRPRMILVGDSRTWAMYGTLYGMPPADLHTTDGHGDVWIARSAVGHSWLVSTAAGCIDAQARPDTAIVILLGVNDASGGRPWSNDLATYGLGNASDYIRTLNGKASQWRASGASVVYCSIMPVGAHTGMNSYTNRLGMQLNNTGNIARWNSDMRGSLSSQVAYLDTYGAIVGNYATIDGLHYDDATNRRIYNYFRASVTL